jgi:SAM-dependent methyltransferase
MQPAARRRLSVHALMRRLLAVAFAVGLAWVGVIVAQQPSRRPDIYYLPTPTSVVDAMLDLAGVTANDVVYDLGSGDGRIVIRAAQKAGARGVGIEIDPALVKRARENARLAFVHERVTFIEGDLFQTDLSNASVVSLYLLSTLNVKLRPKLQKELKPGARIVSHAFDMGNWEPDRTITVDNRRLYLWTIK